MVKDLFAGILERRVLKGAEKGFEHVFTYDGDYVDDPLSPPVSLTLPKTKEPHVSRPLFPFFFGLLAEGGLKALQCRALRIDEREHFRRLIETAGGM